MSNNSSRGDSSAWSNAMKGMIVSEWIFCVVGTVVNLWFLVCILRSHNLRVKLRNQLICNISILHLLQTLVVNPALALIFQGYIGWSTYPGNFFCHAWGIVQTVGYIQSFVVDWILLTLVAVYFSDVVDYNPTLQFKPTTIKIGRVILHIWPWVVAAIVTPIAVSFSKTATSCLTVSSSHYLIFDIAYTILPLSLAILTFTLATIFRCSGCGHAGGNMSVQLVERGPEKDNTMAYAVAVIVAIAFEIVNIIYSVNSLQDSSSGGQMLFALAWLVPDLRVIFMLVPWLLFPDIRSILKSWRPWRSSDSTDVTVAYQGRDV